MASAEPKSGKLYKFGHGLFGPKWTEKWVHLDGHLLKYFSMASEQQPLFSLASARQSCAIELAMYDFVVQDDKRITRKHAFHLIPRNKSLKAYVFACGNDQEFREWHDAFQSRLAGPRYSDMPPIVAEKMRRAMDAFTACDPRQTGKVDASKLRGLLQTLGWQGDLTEYSIVQQQLDPNMEGKISKDQFLLVMKEYFMRREGSNDKESRRSEVVQTEEVHHTKRSEPEQASECELLHDDEANNSTAGVLRDGDAFSSNDTGQEPTPERDWQREFDSFLDTPPSDDDVYGNGLQLAAFISQFRLKSEQTMEAIVHEIALDEDARTIASVPLDDDQFMATHGGSSSGVVTADDELRESTTKFVANGFLVYVTHDKTARAMFGHQIRAAKALHDAVVAMRQAQVGTAVATECLVALPLQCIVDYLGFRGLIIALPSSQRGTPRITSSRMLLKENQQTIIRQLETIYNALGIYVEDVQPGVSTGDLPHFVGASTGGGPGSHSHQIFLHNLHDTFPIDANQVPLDPTTFERRRFRPEFVSQYGDTVPLHPSAHSCRPATHSLILQQAAINASEHLRTVVVPAFVTNVEAQCTQIYDSATLTAALHRDGINVRYLGMCFQLAQSKHVKRLFLSEMIGRVCKSELCLALQAVFRDAVDDVKRVARVLSGCQDEPNEPQSLDETEENDSFSLDPVGLLDVQAVSQQVLRETASSVVLAFFNLVFGVACVDSKRLWHDRIFPQMRETFEFAAASSIGVFASGVDQLVHEELIHWPQVFHSALFHTNVQVADDVEILYGTSLPFPDKDTAMVVVPSAKLLCRTTPSCELQLALADELLATDNFHDALACVEAQIAIVDAAPRDDKTPSLGHLFTCASELSLRLQAPKEAEKFALLALKVSSKRSVTYARALLCQLKAMHAMGHSSMEQLTVIVKEAVEIAKSHLGGMHPILYDFYMTIIEIARDKDDRDTVGKTFTEAAVLIKECYGRTCLLYADVRRSQGESLLLLLGGGEDSDQVEHAISVLDEALSIYERHDHEAQELMDQDALHSAQTQAASCLSTTAALQAAQGTPTALELAFSTAVRAYGMRMQVLPANHIDILSSLLQLGELCVALGDAYRALEYYRPALVMLKNQPLASEQVVEQLRKVSQAVLSLCIQSLPAEKQTIVDKTKKNFSETIDRFADEPNTLPPQPSVKADEAPEPKLLQFVIKQLLDKDPVEYVYELIAKTDSELQALRRQSFLLSSVSRDSASTSTAAAEAPITPLCSPLSPGTSRFASFAFGQPPQLALRSPSSPLPPSSPASGGGLLGASSPMRRNGPSIYHGTGEFTSGAQLATVLYLSSLSNE